MDDACISCITLLLGNKLPSAVWAIVAAQVSAPKDGPLDESDVEEDMEHEGGGFELDDLSRVNERVENSAAGSSS